MSVVPLYRNPRPMSGLELLEWFESTQERWTSQIGFIFFTVLTFFMVLTSNCIFMVLTSNCSVQSRVITDISITFLVDFCTKFIVWVARRSTTRVLYVQGFLVNEKYPSCE